MNRETMPGTVASEALLGPFIERARQLYSPPAVALRILELTKSPSVDIRELQRCVASDPALASKLLRVVNSSLFGLTKPVGNLSQAISLLGIQRLKMLVLGFSLPVHSSAAVQPAVLDRYWRHALTKSVTARELAESFSRLSGDEAFISGLLQDLGLLVLVQDLGDSYMKFLHGVWSVGNDPRAMESEVLGFDHVEVTVRLLENWGLPRQMLRAMATPLGPQCIEQLELRERPLAQVLELAELLTRFLLDRQLRWLDEFTKSGELYFGLRMEQLKSVVARIEKTAPELAAALSIPWSDETHYVSLLEQTHQRQAETISEVAGEVLAPPLRPLEAFAGAMAGEIAVRAGRPAATPPTRQRHSSLTRVAAGNLASTPDSPPDPTARPAEPALSLEERLATAIASCRQSRSPISLVLVQLDDMQTLSLALDAKQIARLLQDMKLLIYDAAEPNVNVIVQSTSNSRMAGILSGADRKQGIAIARQVLDRARKSPDHRGSRHLSLSVGLATLAMPPRNFPVEDLVQAAERCLNGVQLCGGNGMKSIEIC